MRDNIPENIQSWRAELGLLPVPLAPNRSAYVLLNGARGNFCLEMDSGQRDEFDRRSEAWSANVGHFVIVSKDTVAVQRWDQPPGTVQELRPEEVRSDLAAFHARLERSAPPTELSIITHGIRVFRQLRTGLGPDASGAEAMICFLHLLASIADNVGPQDVRLDTWGLPPSSREIAREVPEHIWNALSRELIQGLPIQHLRPDIQILIRHASGPLFQEAHYLAQFKFTYQPKLGGLELAPEPVAILPHAAGIGLYFTPPALARTLVEEAICELGPPPSSLRVLDPACGSGEFLREAIRQLRLKGFAGNIEVIGWDISPAACSMARFAVARELWSDGEKDVRTSVRIEQRDALATEWPPAHLILMNPPYLSIGDLSAEHKDQVRSILGSLARGRLDLSSAFIWKATTSLPRGSVVASVLPASFLEGESFAKIRGEIAGLLTPSLVARLGSQDLFQHASVDSALYVGKRDSGIGPATAVWADHRSSSSSAALRTLRRLRWLERRSDEVIEDGFSIFPNNEIGIDEHSWAPRPFIEWSLRKRAGHLPRATDCFDVRQGALTGFNKAFLVRDTFLQSLSKSERVFFRPAVLNESVQEGMLKPLVHVFYPYDDFRVHSEQELREKLPTFYEKRLRPNRARLRARKVGGSTRWWELTRHREWQVQHQAKLVTTYFGERGSFAWDAVGDYVVVQGYAWRAKRGTRIIGNLGWLAYLALLNSELFQRMLAATSDNVGGGQWNLSIRYVKHVPLPLLPLEGEEARITQQLARLGSQIHKKGLDNLGDECSVQLEELAEAAYGVENPTHR